MATHKNWCRLLYIYIYIVELKVEKSKQREVDEIINNLMSNKAPVENNIGAELIMNGSVVMKRKIKETI